MNSDKKLVVVGKKQILRLMKENELAYIQIATDADKEYVNSLVSVARLHNLRVEVCGTKEEIAFMFGIDVPTGAVGFLKN